MTGTCVVRLRKSIKNPLLDRNQYQIQIIHEGSAAPTIKQVQQQIASRLRVNVE